MIAWHYIMTKEQGELAEATADFYFRPRETMVGVNMVLAEYHQNTLK